MTNMPKHHLVAAPKDYLIGPVFAAVPQTGSREVTIVNHKYLLGGFNPLKPNLHPPALDVRHARAIFTLLSFRDSIHEDRTRLIRFSMNEFCRRYADSQGGRYSRAIAGILGDLLDGYMRVTDIKTGIAHTYRFIERLDIEHHPIRRKDASLATTKQMEMWLNGCTLSPEFYDLMKQVAELQHLRLDALNAIRSPLAQAIYLYIPSRAHHHTKNDPFEITLIKLLEQVSHPVPAHKSLRKRLFTQNKNSILSQLDGLETLSGRFHVRLEETADGLDWKLLAWIEQESPKIPPGPPKEDGPLLLAFLASGRSRAEWESARALVTPLSGYERDMLATADIDLDKSERFMEMARAIIGETRFVMLLAEAKGDRLEGRKATKTPTARLINRLMEAVKNPQKR